MIPRVYFDLCALKRPWDDQSQPRIASETLIMSFSVLFPAA
jgi:hypothetical protein